MNGNNNITFEVAMDTLVTMFPTWQRDALAQILIKKKGHMESAVEAILVMEGQVQAPAPAPARPTQTNNSYIPNDYSDRPRQQQQNYNSGPVARDDPKRNYRGTLCELPHDFLRPPSIFNKGHNMNDEELALMLQNELFQREAFAALGTDMRGIRPTGQYLSRGGENVPVHGGNRMQNSQSTQSERIPDMGILKGLSTMSAAAKAKLSELADRFQNSSNSNSSSSSSSSSGGGGSGFGFGRNKVQVGSGGGGSERERQTEMRRLMDDNDEEDDEVIDFANSSSNNGGRGQHSLNPNPTTTRKKDV